MRLVGGFVEDDDVLCIGGAVARWRGGARNDAEILFFSCILVPPYLRTPVLPYFFPRKKFHHLPKLHIPLNKEDAVVGTVILTGETKGIGGGVLTEAFGITKDVMTQGMSFEEDILEVIIDQLCR